MKELKIIVIIYNIITLEIWKQHVIDEEGNHSIFLEMDKLKIFNTAIHSQLVIPRLLDQDMIQGYFPLHNNFRLHGITPILNSPTEQGHTEEPLANTTTNTPQTLTKTELLSELHELIFEEKMKTKGRSLMEKWKFNWKKCWLVPGSPIRKYFGEKLGMYFRWLSLYTQYCLGFSIIGIIAFIILLVAQYQSEEPGMPSVEYLVVGIIFTVLIIIWTTVFQEHWKRKQIFYASKWMQIDFHSDETIRAEFHGIVRRSPITDEYNELYYPEWKRTLKISFGASLSFILICISIAACYFISYAKDYYLEKFEDEAFENLIPTLASGINAIQILVFNLLFEKISEKLTKYENHKTQTNYEISLIIKSYIFQFCNSYFSLFFIAFLKDKCIGMNEKGSYQANDDYSCIFELEIQLRMIFLFSIAKNLLEVRIIYIYI